MGWYNSSWLKRKAVTLTGGASGAQTDYQVKLTVTYDSDMQVDFDDLRFTKADGTTLLDAWLESKVDSTSATVWVETDTPANTVEADIYMYYGNSGAASDWDCQATMLDGDDFTGSTLDTSIWDSQNCNTAVSAGKLTIDTFSGGNRYAGGIKGKIAIAPSSVTEVKAKQLYTGDQVVFGLAEVWDLAGTCDHQGIGFFPSDLMYIWCKNDTSQSLGGKSGLNVVYEYHYIITNTGSQIQYTYDGTTHQSSPLTTNNPNENMYMRISGDNTASGTAEVDWIFSHKYAANPATYVFGSEETPTGGWNNKVFGVTSPARVLSVLNANIGKVIGV